MKSLFGCGAAAFALLVAGCGDGGTSDGNKMSSAPIPTIAAPNGGDWTQVVSETPEGGFRMGNPNAPVKLVEFGSLTCHVCAEFSEQGSAALAEKYVKTGQVSFELRNYVRDPADIGAALLSRCSGPAPYFQLSDQLFAAQEEWMGKLQSLPSEEQQRLFTLPPAQSIPALAKAAGLDQFVKVRGIPAAKAEACLSDDAQIQKLVRMNDVANREYEISGTPTFLINGKVVDNTTSWSALEPELRAAIGG